MPALKVLISKFRQYICKTSKDKLNNKKSDIDTSHLAQYSFEYRRFSVDKQILPE